MPEKPKRHRYQDPMAVECPECHRPVSSPYGNGRAWHIECWAISPERQATEQPETVTGKALRAAREAACAVPSPNPQQRVPSAV